MSSTEGIPIRRLVVHDPKDMPLHYGETPGGSIFSTTPGGKISFSSWKSNSCFFFRIQALEFITIEHSCFLDVIHRWHVRHRVCLLYRKVC